MSLFQVNELWATQLGQNSEFDTNSLTISNIDNEPNGPQKIVTASFQGILRVHLPKKGFSIEDLLLEHDLQSPALQIASGRFISQLNIQALAILHPRRISIYTVEKNMQTQVLSVKLMYEHDLNRNAFNLCVGGFGGINKTDFFCVQSSDGAFFFYEHENFSFAIQLPRCLIPGPLAYCAQIDALIVGNSMMEVEAYSYSKLRDAYNRHKQGQETSFQPDWVSNVGEVINSIICPKNEGALHAQKPDIWALGEHSIFGIMNTSFIKIQKRFDFQPACVHAYNVGSTQMVLVGSFSRHLLIYKDTQLYWACRLNIEAVCIKQIQMDITNGLLVLLNDSGELQVCYLGTQTSKFQIPQRELNYGLIDQEYSSLLAKINKGNLVVESVDAMQLNVQLIPNLEQEHKQYDVENKYAHRNNSIIKSIARLSISFQGDLCEHITIQIKTPACVECPQNPVFIESLRGNSTPYVQNLTFYTLKNVEPDDLNVIIEASYLSKKQPKQAKCEFLLMLHQVAFPIQNQQDGTFKITLKTEATPPSISDLFQDFAENIQLSSSVT